MLQTTAMRVLFGIALATLGAPACRKSVSDATDTVTFVEDDFEGALARAKREGKPLFVDAWAPWCHTCLSMRSYVFSDAAALRPVAGRFVWAAIDTEKPQNEAFTRRYPVQFWPTLWVIDATTASPMLKWPGSVTAPELVTLLETATGDPGGRTQQGEAAAAWIRGNREAAEHRPERAIAEYEDALARAPREWATRARVVESLALQLQRGERNAECLALAGQEFATMSPGTSRVDVVLTGLACADKLGPPSKRGPVYEALIAETGRMARDDTTPILPDDRSSLFEQLVGHFRETHQDARVSEVAVAWRDFLAREAGQAKDPAARAVFDAHRVSAYAESGEPEKALAMLADSERDFPSDYNAPARLAKVNLNLGRLDAALQAVERAERLAYGPRTMRVLALKADILEALRRPEDARSALTRAVAIGDALPLTGGYRTLLEQLRTRVAK